MGDRPRNDSGRIRMNLGPLIASAGVIGIAFGLGAQSLVRDVLAGLFMLIEDQYGVGDRIDALEISGVVVRVGLRITNVRDDAGTLWYLRNGEILKVGNRSQSG
jgi:small-conductance mechanosensitive channel